MPAWTAFLSVIALLKLIETGMPTPTVEPSSGGKFPMKLLAGDTVVKEEFSCASRPFESCAVALILYVVERSNWASGFQLVPSAERVPLTLSPAAVVIVTTVSLPLATVTLAALLMLALVAPFFGEIAICASEASAAAALST